MIIVKPIEIQRAIREQQKSKQEKEQEDLDAEAARRLAQMVRDSATKTEQQVKSTGYTYDSGKAGCNPTQSVCVKWENPDEDLPQNRGRGIAFRDNQPDHYAEVKTQGFRSNTTITITQNDNVATALLGDGSPGGNVVTIKQSNGVRRVP